MPTPVRRRSSMPTTKRMLASPSGTRCPQQAQRTSLQPEPTRRTMRLNEGRAEGELPRFQPVTTFVMLGPSGLMGGGGFLERQEVSQEPRHPGGGLGPSGVDRCGHRDSPAAVVANLHVGRYRSSVPTADWKLFDGVSNRRCDCWVVRRRVHCHIRQVRAHHPEVTTPGPQWAELGPCRGYPNRLRSPLCLACRAEICPAWGNSVYS